jgi:hypothetical protein
MKKLKQASKEYTRFSNALQKILRTTHSELKAALKDEKQRKKRNIKRRDASLDADVSS